MSTFDLPVIPLAIMASLTLVFSFIVFFLHEQSRRLSNAERESLLPLAEETPRVAGAADLPDHDHASEPHGCGCQSGHRAPCEGCLKRSVAPHVPPSRHA